MEAYDLLIVGAGAAGIAAAKAAAPCGRVALVECRTAMGGVLLQCAHQGFGQRQTGPEYIRQLLDGFPESVEFFPDTTVLSVGANRTAQLSGGRSLSFRQLILATGCREIPAGSLPIAGTRPKGVYTAGQMQARINLHGFRPQGPVVILGSGDIGLIVAAQLAELGIPISGIVEQRPCIGGLARNRQFLRRTSLPVFLNNTVAELRGYPQLEGVSLLDGTLLPCRTLLIAVGLRPETELVWHLGNPDWLTLCGNCRRVQPMVEAVVNEGIQAGLTAGKQMR